MTYKDSGLDVAAGLSKYISKGELIDKYPSLLNPSKSAGLWCWGYNVSGQMGDSTTANRSSPVQTVAGGINWEQISCSDSSTGIKSDGTLWVWGSDLYGQLARGAVAIAHQSSPIQVAGTTWKQAASGNNNHAAVKTDGTLWVWGWNSNGELGTNNITNRSSPVQVLGSTTLWKQVSILQHTAAIKTNGELWTWGRNDYGQLGLNDALVSRSSLTQIYGGGTNWKTVSCGLLHTAALKTNGTIWCWGRSVRIGDNTTANKSSPVQIGSGTDWKQISAGYEHTAAVKTDGTLWVWGLNGDGQLGTGDTASKSSPVQTICAGTNWRQVSCSLDAAGLTTAAIKTDGTLWTWGHNLYGELGDNSTTTRSSPVQIYGGGSNWKMVVAGGNKNMMAIRDFTEDF